MLGYFLRYTSYLEPFTESYNLAAGTGWKVRVGAGTSKTFDHLKQPFRVAST